MKGVVREAPREIPSSTDASGVVAVKGGDQAPNHDVSRVVTNTKKAGKSEGYPAFFIFLYRDYFFFKYTLPSKRRST